MSAVKERVSLTEARALAEEVVDLLRGAAVRIEIAGSIRRGKADIGDIEIVLQAGKAPNDPLDVLIANLRDANVITPVLRADGKNEAWGERHKRGYYKGMRLDLFIVRPDRAWGVTFLIRTGPGDANAYLVTRRNPGGSGYGGCPPHLVFHEGNIYRLAYPVQSEIKKLPPGAWRLDLPEEIDVYTALGMPYVAPEARTIEAYEKLRGTATPALDVPTEPVTVYTGRINCGDPDALEITVGAIEADRATEYGVILAPTRDMVDGHKSRALSDAQYTAKYLDLLRWRYKWHPQMFMDILAGERIVLTCYCAAGGFCHRHLAVEALAKIAGALGIPFTAGGELESPPEQDPEPAPHTLALPDMPSPLIQHQPADEESERAYRTHGAKLWARFYPSTSEAAWYRYFKSGCNEALRPVPLGTPMIKPKPEQKTQLKYPDDGVLIREEGGEIIVEETRYGVKTVQRTPISEIPISQAAKSISPKQKRKRVNA